MALFYKTENIWRHFKTAVPLEDLNDDVINGAEAVFVDIISCLVMV